MKILEAYLYIQFCLESSFQNFYQAFFSKILQGTKGQQTWGDAAGGNYQQLQQKSLLRHYSFPQAVQGLQPSKNCYQQIKRKKVVWDLGKKENVTHDRYLIHSTSRLYLCLCFALLRHLAYENTPVQTVQTTEQQEPQEVCSHELLAFLDSAMW